MMRCVLILCLLLAATPLRADEAKKESAEAFIREWAAAFNDGEELEKLVAFYDPSEETELIASSGLLSRGIKAIAAQYRESFEAVTFSESTVGKMTSRALGDTAVVTFEHRFRIESHADKSRWQLHVRTTSVLRQVEGKWRIVHEHSSPIQGIERATLLDAEP